MKKMILKGIAKVFVLNSLLLGFNASSFAAISNNNAFNIIATTMSRSAAESIQIPAKYVHNVKKLDLHFNNKANPLHKVLNDDTRRIQFKFVIHKLDELKLPRELALIPVIESQYNPKAVSPKGAGGLWQLMPATAKEYGISNQGRFELSPSTVAALKFFKQLHHTHGNWEFVIAAYNAGSGRVKKALKQNPNAASVQELKLPSETRNYVRSFYQLEEDLKYHQV